VNIQDEIISLIKTNRISTTEVSDALGKKGGLLGIKPLNRGKFAVGKIFHCNPRNNSNYEVHRKIESVNPNEIILISPSHFTEVAVFGDLVAKYCLLYKQAEAIVVNGNVRDVARLLKEDYKIWSKGINPVGAVNDNVLDSTNTEDNFWDMSGGIAVCDDGGVVIIETQEITTKTYENLVRIEALEDLWQYCLNTLKWSTLDIVVNKRYCKDQQNIPSALLKAAGIDRI
jgi:4-hydroxy-4-methyl-2-oxoglutarate aldolase